MDRLLKDQVGGWLVAHLEGLLYSSQVNRQEDYRVTYSALADRAEELGLTKVARYYRRWARKM